MKDYIYFIDQELIDQGNKHFQMGNYSMAEISYEAALDKLRDYDGDRMHPIMVASELVKKIEECKSKAYLRTGH